MANPFVGQLMLVPYNFAPRGWAMCAGQLMSISQNTALFSLLGTYYGGDGKSTFALPNLQGEVPIGVGQSQGGSNYFIGENGGSASVTLLQTEMPMHIHGVQGATFPAAAGTTAAGNSFGQNNAQQIYVPGTPTPTLNAPMHPQSVGIMGSSLPHNNMMPFLTMNWIIALQGVFPARP